MQKCPQSHPDRSDFQSDQINIMQRLLLASLHMLWIQYFPTIKGPVTLGVLLETWEHSGSSVTESEGRGTPVITTHLCSAGRGVSWPGSVVSPGYHVAPWSAPVDRPAAGGTPRGSSPYLVQLVTALERIFFFCVIGYSTIVLQRSFHYKVRPGMKAEIYNTSTSVARSRVSPPIIAQPCERASNWNQNCIIGRRKTNIIRNRFCCEK